MKGHIAYILTGLIIIGGLAAGEGFALSPPDDMIVSVANADFINHPSNIYKVGDPINLKVIVQGSATPVNVSSGFTGQEFRLMLYFTYEDNIVVISNKRDSHSKEYNTEAPFADLIKVDGKLVQVESDETLESNWWWEGDLDATQFYTLTRPGKILVSAKVPLKIYDHDNIIPGTKKAKLCLEENNNLDKCWSGVLESVSIPICITDDLDGDGYYYPCVPDGSATTVVDCDDGDGAVNPGTSEIVGDGRLLNSIIETLRLLPNS